MKDNFKWLQNFYLSQCDDEWEHTYGIKIETLDNPGWNIKIDLAETHWQELKFKNIVIERSENDWINCKKENSSFIGGGGPLNFNEIIGVFRKFIEDSGIDILESYGENYFSINKSLGEFKKGYFLKKNEK